MTGALKKKKGNKEKEKEENTEKNELNSGTVLSRLTLVVSWKETFFSIERQVIINWVHRRWSGHDCTNEPISLSMLN